MGFRYCGGGRVGGRVGLGVGVGVVGPAGMLTDDAVEEGCALIGLGAEIGDIHRGGGDLSLECPRRILDGDQSLERGGKSRFQI